MRFPFTKKTIAEATDVPVVRPEQQSAEPEKALDLTQEKDEERSGGGGGNGGVVERDSDAVSIDAQAGVQKIEATTKAWSWSHVVAAYVM